MSGSSASGKPSTAGAVHPQVRSMRQRHDPQREIGQFGEPEQLLALGVHDNRAAHRSVSALIRRERRPASTDHPDRKPGSAGSCARPPGPRAAASAGPVAHSVPLARSPRSAASRAHGPMRTPTPRRRRPPPMAGRPCSCHQTLLLSLASQLQIRLPVAERDPVFVQHLTTSTLRGLTVLHPAQPGGREFEPPADHFRSIRDRTRNSRSTRVRR